MITDEQVRIALAVWYQDDEYTRLGYAGENALRDMRAALEAALGEGEQLEADRSHVRDELLDFCDRIRPAVGT